MDEYFVRIYHMKDGTTREIQEVYALYEQALMDLDKFNPNGDKEQLGDGLGATPEEDMELVSYVTIEKRYVPKGRCWSAEESKPSTMHRVRHLMEYLDHLAPLKDRNYYVNDEIKRVIQAINAELDIVV